MRDPYEILQVARNAEIEVIQAAYRRLARKYHPDTGASPDATERMRQLNWAYEILSDPEKRASYDQRFRTESSHASSATRERPESEPQPAPAPPPPPRRSTRDLGPFDRPRKKYYWPLALVLLVGACAVLGDWAGRENDSVGPVVRRSIPTATSPDISSYVAEQSPTPPYFTSYVSEETPAAAGTPYAVVTADSLHLRAGPSTAWRSLGWLAKGTKRPVAGINPDGTWIALKNPIDSSIDGWVSARYVEISPKSSSLRVYRFYDCEYWYTYRPAEGREDCPLHHISEVPIAQATPEYDLGYDQAALLQRMAELIDQCGWDRGCWFQYCLSQGWDDCGRYAPDEGVIMEVECEMCFTKEPGFDQNHCFDRCMTDYCLKHAQYPWCAEYLVNE